MTPRQPKLEAVGHTAWDVETNFPRTPAFRVVQPRFPGSGVLNTIVETDDEQIAHLIAAAPDLLSELKAALYAITEIDNSHKALRKIRAAIAKAEGRAS